nr:hypothetical protein [Tanacetum cinerariifolium]
MAPLPPRDQRHIWLRYQVVGYTKEIVHDFEQRLETIFGRQVNRVHKLDFEGLTLDMRQDLTERMRMVYTRDGGQELGGARRSMTWRQFILALGFHTAEEMAEDGFGIYWSGSERVIPDKGDLSDYWVEISFDMDFLRGAPSRGQAPEKVTATDIFYLRNMDRGEADISYLLAQYLFRYAEGRKSDARLSEGHFIRRLAHYFGLVSDDRLRGLSVLARELPLIDMGTLVVHHHLQLQVGLYPRDWGDLRRRFRDYLMEASGQTYQAFDGTFRGSSPAVFERRTRQRTGEASTFATPQQPDP